MKGSIRLALIGFVTLFVVIFAIRFAFDGHWRNSLDPSQTQMDGSGSWTEMKQNYASTKMNRQDTKSGALTVDQKYEQIATINSTTEDFGADELRLRGLVKSQGALIQFEQSQGLKDARNLRLAIGVPPDRFDALVLELRKIGILRQIQVNKKDKTNEYRDLQAQKASLDKTRSSLAELKTRGGRIEELVALEMRILEIDEKAQELGVKLGEYDAENEFCTVLVSIDEKQKTHPPTIATRLRASLRWTVPVWAGLVAAVFGLLTVAWLSVIVLEKTRVIKPIG